MVAPTFKGLKLADDARLARFAKKLVADDASDCKSPGEFRRLTRRRDINETWIELAALGPWRSSRARERHYDYHYARPEYAQLGARLREMVLDLYRAQHLVGIGEGTRWGDYQ